MQDIDATAHLTADADWWLKAGITIHMYTLMAAGIAFSETVHPTAHGPERLTTTERQLVQCGEEVA